MYDNVTAVVPCGCPRMSACNSVSPQLRMAGSMCAAVPLIRVTGRVAAQGVSVTLAPVGLEPLHRYSVCLPM